MPRPSSAWGEAELSPAQEEKLNLDDD